MGLVLKRRELGSFLVAAALGAAIWGFSPKITGHAEPWDAQSIYYLGSLFVAGAIVGLSWPRQILPAFLGIVAGQMIYMFVFLPSGPLILVGVLFLVLFSLVSLVGFALASAVRRR